MLPWRGIRDLEEVGLFTCWILSDKKSHIFDRQLAKGLFQISTAILIDVEKMYFPLWNIQVRQESWISQIFPMLI